MKSVSHWNTRVLAALLVASLAALMLAGCTSTRAAASSKAEPVLTFIVAGVAEGTLEGVEVFGASSRGLKKLGATDGVGSFTVKRSVVRVDAAEAVLFCLEGYFCGAVRPDEQGFDQSHDYFVVLAARAVR